MDLAARRCPQCLTPSDTETGVNGARIPKPGDLCICLYCSAVNVFQDNPLCDPPLVVRRATDAELDEALADPVVRDALKGLGEMRTAGQLPTPWKDR